MNKIPCYVFLLLPGSSDNLIPAGKYKQPSIATIPQTYRVPAGGDAELECKLLNLGDSVQLWKNGTRVISVGSLQVKHFSLLNIFHNLLFRFEMIRGLYGVWTSSWLEKLMFGTLGHTPVKLKLIWMNKQQSLIFYKF